MGPWRIGLAQPWRVVDARALCLSACSCDRCWVCRSSGCLCRRYSGQSPGAQSRAGCRGELDRLLRQRRLYHAHFSSAHMVFTNTLVSSIVSTPAFSHGGYFIGGGVEAALTSGWFWRNEYRIASYGNQVLTDTNGAGAFANHINFKPTVQTVTSQLVYKFNWTRDRQASMTMNAPGWIPARDFCIKRPPESRLPRRARWEAGNSRWRRWRFWQARCTDALANVAFRTIRRPASASAAIKRTTST